MKTLLVVAAVMGFGLTNAGACEYMRSAKAQTVDKTVVASIQTQQSEPVQQSTPEASSVKIEEPAK